jgi:hypothetical protein
VKTAVLREPIHPLKPKIIRISEDFEPTDESTELTTSNFINLDTISWKIDGPLVDTEDEVLKTFEETVWFSDSTFMSGISRINDLLENLNPEGRNDIQFFDSQFCHIFPNHRNPSEYLRSQKLVNSPRLIIMIIFSGGNHWQIQWIHITPEHTFWYFYCSLNHTRNAKETDFILELLPILSPLAHKPKECLIVRGPKQPNGYDCGPYVYTAMMHIIAGIKHGLWKFSVADMPFVRSIECLEGCARFNDSYANEITV